MGGEPSKASGSSIGSYNRERKRSGVANALAGGDCRSTPIGKRPAPIGPSHGEAPERIPHSPVRCTPSSIARAVALDKSLTWLTDTEATLVTEWNRERQGRGIDGTGMTRPAQSPAVGEGMGSPTKAANGASSPPTPGISSSANLSPSGATSAGGGLPLRCDSAPAITGRTTGLSFSSSSPVGEGGGGVPTGATAATRTSAEEESTVTALPVGIDYYRALQARWSTPEACTMPPVANESDLNDSTILEAVADPDGDVLSPPVPLRYMIDLFVPQWRAEGLYDQADLSATVH